MTPLATQLLAGSTAPVTLDWAESQQTHTNTPSSLLSWLRQSPSLRGVHVVLSTADRAERRAIRNELLALGCVVTSKMRIGSITTL